MTEWTRVDYKYPNDWTYGQIMHDRRINEWCRNNCEGNWGSGVGSIEFELPKDATLFALRWS